jgi:hypothetical protein
MDRDLVPSTAMRIPAAALTVGMTTLNALAHRRKVQGALLGLVAVVTLLMMTAPTSQAAPAAASVAQSACPVVAAIGSDRYLDSRTLSTSISIAVPCNISDARIVTSVKDFFGHTLLSFSYSGLHLYANHLSPTFWMTYHTSVGRIVYFYATVYSGSRTVATYLYGGYFLPR